MKTEQLDARAFLFHKAGESWEDLQDRIHMHESRVAISDGATTSLMSKLWSKILTQSFVMEAGLRLDLAVKNRNDLEAQEQIQAWLRQAQESWRKEIDQLNTSDGQYYLRNAISQGNTAGATFIGLEFYSTTPCHCPLQPYPYIALGIGDSFLLKFSSNGRLVEGSAFPHPLPYLFDNLPDYLDSGLGKSGKGKLTCNEGTFCLGETLLLATDALADFILGEISRDEFHIDKYWNLSSQTEFENMVSRAREHPISPLKDDDTALIMLRWPEYKETEKKGPIIQCLSKDFPMIHEWSAQPFHADIAQNREPEKISSMATSENPNTNLDNFQPILKTPTEDLETK